LYVETKIAIIVDAVIASTVTVIMFLFYLSLLFFDCHRHDILFRYGIPAIQISLC